MMQSKTTACTHISDVRQLHWGLLLGLLMSLPLVTGCDSSGNMQSNDPPTADAAVATSQPYTVGDEIIFDGTGSSDPDGDDLQFNWSLSTPSQSSASLQDAGTSEPTFTPDVAGDYTASVEVSDGNDQDTDQVSVTVQTGSSGSASAELGSNVTTDRTLSADTSYVVTTNVCIQNGATLTIEAGTALRFQKDQSLRVCENNSAIDANGSSNDPILMAATTGDEAQGWWQGLKIESDNPNNSLEYVEIKHAGSSSIYQEKTAIGIKKGGELSLANSTITMSGGNGLFVEQDPPTNARPTLSLSSNTYENNEMAALALPFENASDVSGASTFGSDSYVRIKTGPAPNTGDRTINALNGDTPYRFTSNGIIEGDAAITIEAGTAMEFASDVNLNLTSGDASLIASGTESDKITMTATPGNESKGWWQGVRVDSDNPNNAFEHVEIKHAGSSAIYQEKTAIGVMKGGVFTLKNSTLTMSDGNGLFVEQDPPTNARPTLTLSSNTYENNELAALALPLENANDVDGGSTFGSDSYVRIKSGPFPNSGDRTMDALNGDTPYRFTTTTGIEGTATVTIEAGTEMEFASDANVSVNSNDAALIAAGESSDNQQIRMTSTPGNDQAGFWEGVGINSSNSDNELSNVVIRYAGGGSYDGSIRISPDGILSLQNSEIRDSGNHGVKCHNDPPTNSQGTLNGSGNTYTNIAGDDVKDCQ